MAHELFKGKRKAKFNNAHKAVDRRSDFNRTTGREARARLKTLDDLDQRSRALKQSKRMAARLEADLGGADNLTQLQIDLIQRSVFISLLMNDMEARHYRGEENVPLSKYLSLVSTQNKIAQSLGLKRVARDLTPTIDEYAKTKRIGHVDDADAVGDEE